MKCTLTRKCLSIVLTVTLIFSAIPLFAVPTLAADTDCLTFLEADSHDGYRVYECNQNASGELIIPSEYNGQPVTEIWRMAFHECNNLTSVIIPNTVEQIFPFAFENCESLISVEIPNSVKIIDERAFYGCKSLKSVEIPGGVTSISESAFGGCESLASITISNGVTSIGESAFCDSESLTSITIPNSVTCIENDAFGLCFNLNHIVFTGSSEEWESITVGECNRCLLNATTKHFNATDTDLTYAKKILPTCLADGYTAGVYCNICEKWVSGHEAIKANHTDENGDSICDVCGEPMLSIKAGETKTVEVSKGGMVYLAFEPTISGTYTFTSTGDLEKCGSLYTADMTEITRNYDGGDHHNFKVTRDLEAGTKYYFGASFYYSSDSGSFPVTLTLTKCAEHANIVQHEAVAATCTENGHEAGEYCTDCNSFLTGSVFLAHHSDDNNDGLCDACGATTFSIAAGETKTLQVNAETIYLAFTPTVSGMYTFSSNASSDLDPYGTLYTGDMAVITSDDHSGGNENFKITYHLDAGTKYYFGARFFVASEKGSFPVTLALTECDEHVNTVQHEAVEVTCTTDGHEAGEYCNDCNSFVTGKVIAAHHIALEEKAAVAETCTEDGYTAGTYCNACKTWVYGHRVIKAHHTDKDEDLICDVCGEPELSISMGETKTIYVSAGETVYLAFKPTVSGTYEFSSNTTNDTYGYLYNADKVEISHNDDGENGRNFTVTYHLNAGTKYYFGARYYYATDRGSLPVTLTLTTPDAPTLTPASSSVTIDTEKKLIMGVTSKTASVSDVLSVAESGYTVSALEGYYLGTGSTVTFSVGDFSYEYTVVVTSDLNGDGVIDVLDVAISERIGSGHFSFDDTNDPAGAYRLAADANGDGDMDVKDLSVVVNTALSA